MACLRYPIPPLQMKLHVLTSATWGNAHCLVAHNGNGALSSAEGLALVSVPEDGIREDDGLVGAATGAVFDTDGNESTSLTLFKGGGREGGSQRGEESNGGDGELHFGSLRLKWSY